MENNIIYLFLIYTIINISSETNILEYPLISDISDSDLKPLSITSNDILCPTYIPSLFNPIPLVKNGDYPGPKYLYYSVKIENPIMDESEYEIYKYKLLDNNIEVVFGKDMDNSLDKCYFGLSSGLKEDINLKNNTLDHLKITNQITEKKFSLEKWDLITNPNKIISKFYLGYNHKDFNSKNKNYIGTCQNIKEDTFWGCYFKEMIFNNISIPLKKSEEEDYKIYFSSEDYTIKFPKEFQDLFEKASNGSCQYNAGESKTFCKDWFKEKDSIIPLKLSNDNMDITLEIDNLKRFNSEAEQDSINMIFKKEFEYIIFPLIMFKNFHIQFDADDNIIRFYSTDKNILHVKVKDLQPDNNSSSALTVFLVILIILLLLGLGFGILYCIIKRRNGDSKEINKFTKFEDEEEDFKNMKEKKIY